MKEKQQKETHANERPRYVTRCRGDDLTQWLPQLWFPESPSGNGRAPPAPSGSGRQAPGAALTFAARRAGTLPLRRAPALLRGVPRVPDPARRGAALRQRRGARRGPAGDRRGRRGGRRRQLVRPRGAAPGPAAAAARGAAASSRRLRGRGGAGPPAGGRRARGADAARGGRRARETPARGAGAAPRGAAMLLLLLELEGHRGPHGLETAARSRSAARRRRAPSSGGGGGGRGAAAPHALVGHRPLGPAAGSREKGAERGRVPAGIATPRTAPAPRSPHARPGAPHAARRAAVRLINNSAPAARPAPPAPRALPLAAPPLGSRGYGAPIGCGARCGAAGPARGAGGGRA